MKRSLVASALVLAATSAHGAEVWQISPDCSERVAAAERGLSEESDVAIHMEIANTFHKCGLAREYRRVMFGLVSQLKADAENEPALVSRASIYEPLIAYMIQTRLHQEGSK